VLVRHDPDPQAAEDRAEVMAAGAAHRDRAHDHELVEVLGVRELGHRRRGHVATAEHLVQVHLRDAAAVSCVLWSLTVSMTRLSSTPRIFSSTSSSSASSSPGFRKAEMLSLA